MLYVEWVGERYPVLDPTLPLYAGEPGVAPYICGNANPPPKIEMNSSLEYQKQKVLELKRKFL